MHPIFIAQKRVINREAWQVFINNMHIQKLKNYTHTHAGCRLYPCNNLRDSRLNHFWVQPERFQGLKLFILAVVPIFSLK